MPHTLSIPAADDNEGLPPIPWQRMIELSVGENSGRLRGYLSILTKTTIPDQEMSILKHLRELSTA